MKAARFYEPGKILIENVPDPVCPKDGLLIRIEACAICGTDLKIWRFGNPRVKTPQIIGHELVGEITEIGPEVKGFSVGDYIAMATTIGCGKCNWCTTGHPNRCMNASSISYDYPGGFAEYMAVPSLAVLNGNVVKLPSGMKYESGTLAEPLSCTINGQEISMVGPGDYVLIIGAGPLGCIHAECARAFGATRIVMVEISLHRCDLAKHVDPDAIICSGRKGWEDLILKETNGGADVALVCAPSSKAMEQATQFVRKGGRINFFASLPREKSKILINSRDIHYNELSIAGTSDSTPAHVRIAVDLLATNRVRANRLITHRMPLDDLLRGLEIMKKGEGLKIVVFPGDLN